MATKQRRGVVDAGNAESQRLNVRLSPEAYRRLGVHAVMSGVTPGRLVERLINDHLKEWRVQATRSASVVSDDRPETAAPVNPMPHLAL